jgi:hypothetical protein
MQYYGDSVSRLENIRSTLKHLDPADISMSDIRDRLGPILADLQVLASLRRPDSLKLARVEDGSVRVTIEMVLDEAEAEDMLQKLWGT